MITLAVAALVLIIVVVVLCRVIAGPIREINHWERGADILSNAQRKALQKRR